MPLVPSSTKKPLMSCTPKWARLQLERKRAAVYRRYPFTIILKDREGGEVQPFELKVDPGSKTTGIILVLHGNEEKKVVTVINLEHRGHKIKSKLEKRRGVCRSRRLSSLSLCAIDKVMLQFRVTKSCARQRSFARLQRLLCQLTHFKFLPAFANADLAFLVQLPSRPKGQGLHFRG